MTTGIRKILFSILLAAMVYLGYQYMIKPANSALLDKKVEIRTKLDKLSKLDNSEFANVTADYLDSQLEELQNTLKGLEDKLPYTNEIDKVLHSITVIVQKQGLNPKTIRTLKQKNNNGYVEQPLRMVMTGNYDAFYSFLLELEQLPRIMKINEITLKKLGKTQGQITADFTVSIFFQDKLVVSR